MCHIVQKITDRLIQFLLFISLPLAPVISITEAGRDLAENGHELHSDSKVCVVFRFMENRRQVYGYVIVSLLLFSISPDNMHMYECGRLGGLVNNRSPDVY